MKKEIKKKITIEDLAVIVNKGFGDVYKKMDAGFNGADGKFKEVHKKMDTGFNDVHKKMDTGFSVARKETEDLAVMVGRGFNDVHEKLKEVNDKMAKGFADVNLSLGQARSRLTSLEDNQLDLKLRIDVFNYTKTTDELRGRIIVLEKKVGVKGH